MGAKLGYCTLEEADLIKSLLDKAKLPVEFPEYINREELIKKLDVWNFPDPTIKSEEEILKKLMQGLE